MGNFFDKQGDPCSRWQAWLESQADGLPPARTLDQWTSGLSPEDRTHVHDCAECRVAMDAWLSFRRSLQVSKPAATAPPWFAARVMAAIATREEESRPIAAWIAVPRFASRLALASAALLVFAGSWLYQKTPVRVSKPPASATESLFDSQPPSQADDEVLVSYAEPSESKP